MTVVLICLFGGVGAATRFVLDGIIRARRTHKLPIATIVINVSGSLLIGFLVGAHLSGPMTGSTYLVGTLGFCGGYTTFSTAMVESVRLIQARHYIRALANTFGTLVLTVAAVALGIAVAGLIWS